MDATHFDVFLSHNSRDKAAVERLAAKLKHDGLEPWLDTWCLTPGGRWQDELVTGLHSSDACAVFVGPNGLGDWVYEELGVALDRAAKDRKFRLFLVLLPELPEPFDPTTLPPFLSTRTWVDLRPGIENARAYQHLINAIKGVPFGQQLPSEPNDDVCPYRGLQTFDEAHADLFFGRENEIQRLVERLKGTHFLAVLGPSGSGKSSLVRAGLIPALRAGALPGSSTWSFSTLTPSAHPLTALAAQLTRLYPGEAMHKTLDALALDQRTLHLAASLAMADRPASERVVWVVDQFEEVFTL
ncbi:MAG: toll/interleukin-1 receptor domain-containing protein, partial [Chloroflexota bacterium]